MVRAANLSFQGFKAGCMAWLEQSNARLTTGDQDPSLAYAHGWVWKEHPFVSQLGHLTRSFELPVHVPLDRGARPTYDGKNGSEDREEDEILESMAIDDDEMQDETEADAQQVCVPKASGHSREGPSAILRITHLITHSATWGVPVLYVGISRTDGQLCTELAHDEAVLFGSDISIEGKSKSTSSSSGAHEEVVSTGIFRRGSGPASALIRRPLNTATIDETSLQSRFKAGGWNDGEHNKNDNEPDPPAPTQMAYFPPIAPCEWPLPPTRASQSAMPAGAWPRRGGDEGEDDQPQVAWSLHPCQTSVVVAELLEVGSQREGTAGNGSVSKGEDDTGWSRRYIECFVAICASAVEMRV